MPTLPSSGYILTVDPPLKQFLLHLNKQNLANSIGQFLIEDLDSTHILICNGGFNSGTGSTGGKTTGYTHEFDTELNSVSDSAPKKAVVDKESGSEEGGSHDRGDALAWILQKVEDWMDGNVYEGGRENLAGATDKGEGNKRQRR